MSYISYRQFSFFKAYIDSQRKWKHKYFYVVPVNRSAVDVVGVLNEEGELIKNRFPLGWSEEHFGYIVVDYAVEGGQLESDNRKTLDMLQAIVGRSFNYLKLIILNFKKIFSLLVRVYFTIFLFSLFNFI